MRRRGRLQNRMLYETHAKMRFVPGVNESEEFAKRWEETFGRPKDAPSGDKRESDGDVTEEAVP